MGRRMGKEFITTKLEESTKDNGSMIKNTVLEPSSMPMEIDTRAPGEMARDGKTASINIQMGMSTKDSGEMISNRAMAS